LILIRKATIPHAQNRYFYLFQSSDSTLYCITIALICRNIPILYSHSHFCPCLPPHKASGLGKLLQHPAQPEEEVPGHTTHWTGYYNTPPHLELLKSLSHLNNKIKYFLEDKN
jgi:hypothetical protein